MLNFVNKLFGSSSTKKIKSFEKIVFQINNIENEIQTLEDQELKQKTQYFKEKLKNGSTIDDILPGARISNAGVLEASSKTFFISGAGGSIGAEITRQLLVANPKRLSCMSQK